MILKLAASTAIAAVFLGGNVARAQITATFSTTSQQITSGVWSFLYASNNQLSRTIVTEGISKRLDMGMLTGYAPGIGQGTTTNLTIPVSMQVNTGQMIDFSILAPIRASAIPYGGPASFDYSLSVNSYGTSVAINDEYMADFNFDGGYSGTYQSTPLYVPLTATATIRRNSPNGVPEPGAIYLISLGGLALAGILQSKRPR